MAENSREETPRQKTSAELIEEARNAFGVDSPSGRDTSEDLMEQAREWIADTDVADMEPILVPVVVESQVDEEIGKLFEAPRSRPADRPRRVANRPIPAPMPDSGRPARRRRRVFGLAAAIGVVALLGNMTALFVSSDSDDAFIPEPTVTVSEGSISSASDPCSGATIAGDLVATITHRTDGTESTLDVNISGSRLLGSDGSTYELQLFGSAVDEPDQNEFVFTSDLMVMTRDDGLEIFDTATFTIEIIGGEATNWSYSSEGADCEA